MKLQLSTTAREALNSLKQASNFDHSLAIGLEQNSTRPSIISILVLSNAFVFAKVKSPIKPSKTDPLN
jgi:hypothetical protein